MGDRAVIEAGQVWQVPGRPELTRAVKRLDDYSGLFYIRGNDPMVATCSMAAFQTWIIRSGAELRETVIPPVTDEQRRDCGGAVS